MKGHTIGIARFLERTRELSTCERRVDDLTLVGKSFHRTLGFPGSLSGRSDDLQRVEVFADLGRFAAADTQD